MTARRRRSGWVALGLCLVPFAAVPMIGVVIAEKLARTVAAPLVAAGDAIGEWTAVKAPEPLTPTPEAERIEALDGKPPPPPAGEGWGGGKLRVELPKPVGVFVSRDRIIAAANAGIRPSGTPVAATWWRPAGIALAGVGYLGVGLRDGDVLVSPGGSENAVVSSVTAALRSRAKAVGGVAWRGFQKIVITVELPDLPDEQEASELAQADESATLAER